VVLVDPGSTKNQAPKGSYYCGGAFGTWFWVDPVYNVVFIGMVNSAGGLSDDANFRQSSAKHVYQALKKWNH